MIQSVTVINSKNESLKMVLTNPQESGLLITNIDGLDAPKADISMMSGAVSDGSFFNYARANSRNVVLDLRYLEGFMSVEAIRHQVYDYFPVKEPVRLVVETDSRTVATRGYVESNSVNIFSATEGSQISILCESAWLTSWNGESEYNDYYYMGLEELFEFPFSNESLTEDMIEFSIWHNETRQDVVYDGEVSTGFIAELRFLDEVLNLTFNNMTSGESIIIDDEMVEELTGDTFQIDDRLIINTIVGQKRIELIRGKHTYNLLPALNSRSKWVQLYQGVNDMWLASTLNNDRIECILQFTNLYQGV